MLKIILTIYTSSWYNNSAWANNLKMQITLDNTKCYLLPISIQRLLHSTIIQRTHRPHNITRHPNIPLFFYFTISSIRVGQQTGHILSQNTFGYVHTKFRIIFFFRDLISNSRIFFFASREREIWSHREIEEKGKTRWIDSHMIYNLLEFVRRKSNE